jgi:hypothetical protein
MRAYADLREFLSVLERQKQLLRVEDRLKPEDLPHLPVIPTIPTLRCSQSARKK